MSSREALIGGITPEAGEAGIGVVEVMLVELEDRTGVQEEEQEAGPSSPFRQVEVVPVS